MLAYVDFFLGGDEKRIDLPPSLHQRFPMSLLFGGDGSYMAPLSLNNDNVITSLMSQVSHPEKNRKGISTDVSISRCFN